MLNADKMVQVFEKHWSSSPPIFRSIIQNWRSVGIDRPGVTPIEAFMLYAMALEEEPQSIFEMGTRQGSITVALAFAQQQRGVTGGYISTEVKGAEAKHARIRLEKMGISKYVDIIVGNGIVLAPNGIDMCVIDADHSYNFAKKYIAELFPKCTNGCFVFTHDHVPHAQKTHTYDGTIDLQNDIDATPRHQEQRAIKEFLIETGIPYSFTEALIGGGEVSINNDLRNSLNNITGTDLFKIYKRATSIFYRIHNE